MRASDVARIVGCSTATVSRVQNSPELVAPQLRDRVLAVIEQLNYTPNNAARSLRSNRTRMIGVVIPTLNHAIYANLVDAAQRRLAEAGYSLLVATFEYDLENESAQTALLIERGTEGLILVGDHHHPSLYQALESTGIPYINTYVFQAQGDRPSIGVDNLMASYDITKFLLGLGHRHFGVISAPMAGNDRAATRVEGIRLALGEAGITLKPSSIVERPYSFTSGSEGLHILLADDTRPTAIICGNDILAFGALTECAERGLSVPDDISVVGFDNLDFASHIRPALTTMEVPAREMGEGAANYLLNTLKGIPTPQKLKLDTKLIVRQTTAIRLGSLVPELEFLPPSSSGPGNV